MCGEVGVWVEQLERIGVKRGGWVEQCPTEGGTDEVKEKWREKRRVKEANTQRTETGSFPFTENRATDGKLHSHLNFKNELSHRNMRVKRCTRTAEPKFN